MSVLDNLKAKLGPAKDRMSDIAHQQGDKIAHGIDKAAHAVDEKTKGKYHDRIDTGSGKAKHAMDRLAHKSAHKGGPETTGQGGDRTPPPPAS
ncbi:antitoxin [Streptomyces sp. V3I7]|uniref:antitoxin n=1 Tax=Streptomyces sp. V3I7 TaxID=3042278 RepID=UPI0027839148|nr:antitoxin [Streptomyces sp. V3I7]MDQ0993463.1 hypothetical protein [Streptomyces sp. V3I7]